MIEELLREVNIITNKNKVNPKFMNILQRKPAIRELLENQDHLDENKDLKLIIRMILDGYTERPTCKQCKENKTKYDYKKSKFKTYCSHRCAWDDPDNVLKSKQTKKERYGSETYNNRAAAEKTIITKYGSKSPMHNIDVKKKKQKTTLKNWGVANPAQSSIVQQKRLKTNQKRYGVSHPIQNSDIFSKKTKTNLEKYNVEYPSQHSSVKLKTKNTNIERYGVEYPSQHLSIKEKIKNTNVERYGVECSLLNKAVQNKRNQSLKQKYGTDIVSEKHLSSDVVKLLKNKLYNTSIPQKELLSYIESVYNGPIISNDKQSISPSEVDILIPDKKIAIEMNGMFYHSDLNGRKKNYHFNKTKKANDVGLRMIHVTDSEWYQKQSIVKDKIKSLLNLNQRIYARKCIVKYINNTKECKTFLNNNHIQGFCPALHSYGLYYQEELVSIMSFGKPRYNKKYEYELIRYCTKGGVTVVGGASKLFSHFTKKRSFSSIVSYCDMRYGTGNVYKQLGFTQINWTSPNCKYFSRSNPMKLYSRERCQKHKLPEILDNFNPDLTAWDNLKNNNYDRIWDCGNTVWVYKS